MTAKMAYGTTSVPIARSKEAIRRLLIAQGVRGVQFSEDFEERRAHVRFAKLVDGNLRTVSIAMQIPDPPKPKRHSYRRAAVSTAKADQMERATYRALHYWLKSQFEAVQFGLLSFEDVFLSHFEWMIDGKTTTVGALIRPRLGDGLPLLTAPSEYDTVDGEFR